MEKRQTNNVQKSRFQPIKSNTRNNCNHKSHKQLRENKLSYIVAFLISSDATKAEIETRSKLNYLLLRKIRINMFLVIDFVIKMNAKSERRFDRSTSKELSK